MAAFIIDYIKNYLGFFWLTGPVLDKELRVSSRQRRSFILRFAYISLLLTILFLIWIEVVDYRGSNLFQVSRMAEAGKKIITFIVWFQFCAAQIIAIVMLSNSIGDEIYHKTLGILMTTPITSIQIVMGKLFSRLLQLFLLLAISMPLLAVIRMFGGVPWRFITSSLFLTFSMVIFVSSLSLFYSIFCRRAYIVIILTVLTLLVLFALLPFLLVSVITLLKLYEVIPERVLLFMLYQPNPYITFLFHTLTMTQPNIMGTFYTSVYINSAFILTLSSLLLLFAVILVRKVALRQATGQLLSPRQKEAIKDEMRISSNKSSSSVISVVGPPILWKELILPLRRNIKIYRLISILIFLAVLIYTYWFFYKERAIQQDYPHVFYSLIFMGLGTLFTIVLSSTSITSEKESSAWPLLLMSTLDDRQIIFGKFCGILSRCLPVWFLLFGHIIIFTFLDIIHPAVIPMTLILVSWFIVLLISSGLYFSSLVKKTTTAVIMNFAFALSIWGLIPLVMGIMSAVMDDRQVLEIGLAFNPFVQMIVIIISTVFTRLHIKSGNMQFEWPTGWESVETTLTIFIVSFCIYMILALFFLWRAKKRLRQKIF